MGSRPVCRRGGTDDKWRESKSNGFGDGKELPLNGRYKVLQVTYIDTGKIEYIAVKSMSSGPRPTKKKIVRKIDGVFSYQEAQKYAEEFNRARGIRENS